MADCPPDCGLCCEQILLSDRMIDRIYTDPLPPFPLVHPQAPDRWLGEDKVFVRAHWTIATERTLHRDVFVQGPADNTSTGRRASCDMYANGRCTAYADRPPICSLYPFYGADPGEDRAVIDHNTCAYHDDMPGRRVLPLTVLR